MSFFKHQYNYKNKTNPKSDVIIKDETVWDNFSLMIRLRDIVRVVSPYEAYCNCITCRKPGHWRTKMDSGHCFTRDKPMTKYHPHNVHAQCHECNRYRKGEQGEYIMRLINLYGMEETEKLKALSLIRGQKKHTPLALYDMNKEYKKEIKRLSLIKKVKVR